MKDQLLELELQILIVRYGRENVEKTLSSLHSASIDEIEQNASRTLVKKEAVQRRRPGRDSDLIAKYFSNRPVSATLAREIMSNFESRRFLPERRDAERFFHRLGNEISLKTRSAAVPHLVAALSKLPDSELQSLTKLSRTTSDGYTLLARQIMSGGSSSPKSTFTTDSTAAINDAQAPTEKPNSRRER